MTTRELHEGNSTLLQPKEKQGGGPGPGIAEYPAKRRTLLPSGSKAEMASGQTAELGWLSHQLEQELDAASMSRYPDIHLFLALNLTDALIRRAVLLRSTLITGQASRKCLSEQAEARYWEQESHEERNGITEQQAWPR